MELRRPKADRNANSKDQVQEISVGKKDSMPLELESMYIVLKQKICLFCSCPEILWKTKIKDCRPVNLAEEISRQPKMALVLLAIFIQVSTENQEQKDI